MRVVAQHGTSTRALSGILHEGFRASVNEWDWLGDGVYFWEDNVSRAIEWAEEREGAEACVIEVELDTDLCVDLTDKRWFELYVDHADTLLGQLKAAGLSLPRQSGKFHGQDRLVMNYMVEQLEAVDVHVTAVRGVFEEGKAAFPDSALRAQSHVQLAVRDLSSVHVRRYWKGGVGWTNLIAPATR